MNVDLVSAGAWDRVLDVDSGRCEGEKLVVAGDPAMSFLIEKLEGPRTGCGAAMPLGLPLSDDEIECVRLWIMDNSSTGGM